jgi:hypothetical protein
MKRRLSIQFKAAFLLTVFSLNIIVGFACSLGLDMRFNTSHHSNEAIEASVHIHADGKKHLHQPEPAKANVHVHADGKKHLHHTEPVAKTQEENEIPKKDKDDCCNDDLLKFQNSDKNLNQNVRAGIDPPALIDILCTFFSIDILKTLEEPQLHTSRYLFPPPPNILIVIHRFQI